MINGKKYTLSETESPEMNSTSESTNINVGNQYRPAQSTNGTSLPLPPGNREDRTPVAPPNAFQNGNITNNRNGRGRVNYSQDRADRSVSNMRNPYYNNRRNTALITPSTYNQVPRHLYHATGASNSNVRRAASNKQQSRRN